jgi:hypothetical protein
MNLFQVLLATFPLLAQCDRRDFCAAGSEEIDGNWYCQAVNAIRYTNVGAQGAYNDIVGMASDGTCASERFEFSGPISPLDEEVRLSSHLHLVRTKAYGHYQLSLHFRGPMHLKQFAVYTPISPTKRDSSYLGRRIAHKHEHNQIEKEGYYAEPENKKREMISASMYGVEVSWENNYHGPSTVESSATSPPQTQMVTATIQGKVVSWPNNWSGTPPPVDPIAFTTTVQKTISTTVCTEANATPAAILDSTGLCKIHDVEDAPLTVTSFRLFGTRTCPRCQHP